MIPTRSFELPEELKPQFKKAIKLEWISIAYLLTVTIVMYLVMGSSQAMKVAWVEDVLSMIPAISFLIASAIYNKAPNGRFPYGYHRAFSIAFLCGSVALLGMGVFLMIDSSMSLIKAEHPTIGAITIGSYTFWLGWLMYLALFYSSLPAMILGRLKLPLAKKLHNKILHTDAETQKADWMTALAAMLGITGIGFGWWWADAVAAILISFSILKDGFKNVKNSVEDLMDRIPQTVDNNEENPLISDLESKLNSMGEIKDFRIRLRENGQVLFGEVYVILTNQGNVVAKIERIKQELLDIHWKLHDMLISPVEQLPEEKENS